MSRARRAIGVVALASAAVVILAWPEAGPEVAFGVVATVLAVLTLWRGERELTLLAIGAVATTTIMLPASAGDWRAWATAGLLIVALDVTLRREGADPGAVWARSAAILAATALLSALFVIWRPVRYSLLGSDGIVVQTLLVAAVGTAFALFVRDEDPPDGAPAAPAPAPSAASHARPRKL